MSKKSKARAKKMRRLLIVAVLLLVQIFPAAYGATESDSPFKLLTGPLPNWRPAGTGEMGEADFFFTEGLLPVFSMDSHENVGYVNALGEVVIPRPSTNGRADRFFEGLALVQNNAGLYGYMNPAGKMVIPFRYAAASNFSEGLAWVQEKDAYGPVSFIDKTGKVVLSNLDLIYPKAFHNGRSVYANDDYLFGAIDKTGKTVIPCQYQALDNFSEGLAAARFSNYLTGVIDSNGKIIVPGKYRTVRAFSEGLAAVENEAKLWGFIDKTGKEVIPCQYYDAYSFSEGLAPVLKNGYYGYIDKTGKVVIDFQYDSFDSFSEGYAPVQANKNHEKAYLYGYIDRAGSVVVDFQYASASEFSNGLASVRYPKGSEIYTGIAVHGYAGGPPHILANTALWKGTSPKVQSLSNTGSRLFTDVNAATPAGRSIEKLATYNFVSGFPGGTYQPQKAVTRAEFCKFLFALGGGDLSLTADELKNIVANKPPFKDVTKADWYFPYVTYCSNNDAVSGVGNGLFAPERTVTMAEAVKMCFATTESYYESSSLAYPKGYWDAAKAKGYFKDIPNVSYNTPCTRELAAQLCYNALWYDSVTSKSAAPAGSPVTEFTVEIPRSYGFMKESNDILAPGYCPFTVRVDLAAPADNVTLTWKTTGWATGDESASQPPKEIQDLAKLEILSFQKVSDTSYEAVVAFAEGFTFEHGTFTGVFSAAVNGTACDSAVYSLSCRGGGGM